MIPPQRPLSMIFANCPFHFCLSSAALAFAGVWKDQCVALKSAVRFVLVQLLSSPQRGQGYVQTNAFSLTTMICPRHLYHSPARPPIPFLLERMLYRGFDREGFDTGRRLKSFPWDLVSGVLELHEEHQPLVLGSSLLHDAVRLRPYVLRAAFGDDVPWSLAARLGKPALHGVAPCRTFFDVAMVFESRR